MPATANAAASDGREDSMIATMRACGRVFGIDRRYIVQAIMVPADMAAMPRRAGAAVGVVSHGDQLLPVVDLKRWEQPDAPDQTDGDDDGQPHDRDARIVILSHGGQVLGLKVDAVIGLRKCPAGAVRNLFHAEAPEELFVQAALFDKGEPPLVLLDPTRLAALTRTWCAQAGMQDDGTAQGAGEPAAATLKPASPQARVASLGTFRIGDAVIGIPADHIAELLRTPALHPAPLPRPATRGLCDWRGHVLPVIDLTGPLQAAVDSQVPPWMCVVRDGERMLGLVVHEIFGLHRAALPESDADTEAGLRQDRAGFVNAELPAEQGIVQAIDPALLMAHFSESALSVRRRGGAAEAERSARSPKPYMVFEAGGLLACEVNGVQEVLPMPEPVRERLAAGLPARLTWRGHAVPVRDALRSADAAEPARQLIVLTQGDQRLAIPIVAVKAMIPAHTGTLCHVGIGGRRMEVVSIQTSEHAASYAVVDLLSHLAVPAAG